MARVSRGAIHLKRAYEAPARSDGKRILVDRLWPRGLSKERAHIDMWAKEVAPSDALRRWYGHEPEKWPAFRLRYLAELEANRDAVTELRARIGTGVATLLFGASDALRNNAVVLKEYLESMRRAPARRASRSRNPDRASSTF
jgi:uncharacterized protein YeaO (DUF488 family)